MEGIDYEEMAEEAKQRGNELFQKKTSEGYQQALEAYNEAIGHDGANHIFRSNTSACHMELATSEYDPVKKLVAHANALVEARKCVELNSDWAKGYIRQTNAEFALISSAAKLEQRNAENAKWDADDKAKANAPPKDPRAPLAVPEEFEAMVSEISYHHIENGCRRGLEIDAKNLTLRTMLQQLRDAGHPTDESNDKAMCDEAAAASAKAEGNKAFSAKDYSVAVTKYTSALSNNPFDHVFYSNRSACYAGLDDFDKALKDAERCIVLNPEFAKGYSRQSVACWQVGRYADAQSAAEAGLAIDPENAALLECLKHAQGETSDSLSVQKQMHELRSQAKKDAAMEKLFKGLGNGVQMFNGSDMGNLGNMFSGGGMSGGGMGGGNPFGGKPKMSEDQMRKMARAIASREE